LSRERAGSPDKISASVIRARQTAIAASTDRLDAQSGCEALVQLAKPADAARRAHSTEVLLDKTTVFRLRWKQTTIRA
jgi:hypothetical protein